MTGVHVLADVMEYAGHSLDAELQQLALQLPHAAQQVRSADPSENCCMNSCQFGGQIRVMGGRMQPARNNCLGDARAVVTGARKPLLGCCRLQTRDASIRPRGCAASSAALLRATRSC